LCIRPLVPDEQVGGALAFDQAVPLFLSVAAVVPKLCVLAADVIADFCLVAAAIA